MLSKDHIRIQHIIESCLAIQKFILHQQRTDLGSNRMLLSAILRELEIIGEAVNMLSEGLRQQHPQIPWKDMIGMRNRLIHAYFDINLDIVWKTVTVDLPDLLKAIQEIRDTI